MTIFNDQDIKNAFLQIARSPGAPMLRQFLLREVLTVSGAATEDGAVRFAEGRRSFALEIIQMMEFEPTDAGSNATELAGKRSGPVSVHSRSLRRVPTDDDSNR